MIEMSQDYHSTYYSAGINNTSAQSNYSPLYDTHPDDQTHLNTATPTSALVKKYLKWNRLQYRSKLCYGIIITLIFFLSTFLFLLFFNSTEKHNLFLSSPAEAAGKLKYKTAKVDTLNPPTTLRALERRSPRWMFGDFIPQYGSLTTKHNISDEADVSDIGDNPNVLGLLYNNTVHRNKNIHSNDRTGPIFFSSYTRQDAEGYAQKRHDDEQCRLSGKYKTFDPVHCLGAPYLYVTFHGGFSANRIKNICKYTRDGCSMGSVLMPSKLHEVHSLRGMLYYGNFLMVAEAWRQQSRVLHFSRCNPTLNYARELLQIVVDGGVNSDNGLIHPYGFAKRVGDPYVYVSVQGSNAVFRYHYLHGTPGKLPKALQDPTKNHLARIHNSFVPSTIQKTNVSSVTTLQQNKAPINFYNGTFVDLQEDPIRGIAFDGQGILYVANKAKGVIVFDHDGYQLEELPFDVKNPISIYYCKERSSLWVGSANKHTLYEFDSSTWQLMQTIEHSLLKHPAGFVSYGDDLFVISQRKNKLLRFSMVTGKLKDTVLPELGDAGERLVLSPC